MAEWIREVWASLEVSFLTPGIPGHPPSPLREPWSPPYHHPLTTTTHTQVSLARGQTKGKTSKS